MAFFNVPKRWRMPLHALQLSFGEMARDGQRSWEGVALWLGRRDGEDAVVTHVVGLRGPGVVKRPDYLFISPELINEVADVASASGTYLLGQIHSHGPGYGVHLSDTDKRFGIAVPGYLSAVAPDYAMRVSTPVADCGFHLYENKLWRRLANQELAKRLYIERDAQVALVTVEAG